MILLADSSLFITTLNLGTLTQIFKCFTTLATRLHMIDAVLTPRTEFPWRPSLVSAKTSQHHANQYQIRSIRSSDAFSSGLPNVKNESMLSLKPESNNRSRLGFSWFIQTPNFCRTLGDDSLGTHNRNNSWCAPWWWLPLVPDGDVFGCEMLLAVCLEPQHHPSPGGEGKEESNKAALFFPLVTRQQGRS